MSTNFPTLKNILAELKRKNSITVLEEHCQEKWEVYDLLMDLTNDENFKQAYIDLSFNKSFKKNFIELANQAKKAVSKYFRDKDIDLRAFYVETNNSDKVLNINLINYNRSEPIRISDILQQERDISTLNIYCDKKHDIYAYRKGKERHYEFKEGAYYEMTSTWPVQDKDGKTFTCTMVMNVSNSGITKVLQFNGKDFESPPEEFLELIRQNEELYIQGLSLHDAVKALLEKNKDAPAVINLQNNEHIVINKDEKMKDLENDAKSNPILSFTSNNVSEVNTQQVATQAIATQTEVNSQHTETQTEVSVQHVKTQTEIGSQQTETQTKVDLQEVAIQTGISLQHTETQTKIGSQQAEIQSLQEVATQTEVNLQHTETQTEVAVQHVETQTGIGSQETETQTEVNSQQLDQKLTKAEQEIRELNELRNNLQYRFDNAEQELEELEKHNSDLQDKLGEEKQKNAKLQTELTQKDEKLANISTELQERVQELEGAYEEKKDLKKKLEVANTRKEELISELRKLHEELNQLKEEKYSLEDKLDQSEHYSNSTKESSEQQISDLKEELLLLKEANQMLKAKQVESEQELVEAKQKIEELKEQCNDLQVECKEKEQRLEKEMSKTDERIIQLNKEQEQKIQEIYGKNKELEEKVEELKENLKTANTEQEKLQGKLNQFEKKEEEIEEAEHMISARDKCIASYKSQIQNLENEHNAHLESDEQEADQLTWDFETLKNELELKDEQIETIRGQLRQEIEEEIVNKYRPSLELKFKEYEDEIERLIREKKELNDKVQYLNNEVELLSPVIDKVLVNKKEVFDNNSKMFYQLTEEIDDSEKKPRSLSLDSAFHSDHCNSLLDLISSPSKVCSQSQRGGV
ncbi:hypothetical protein JKF54_05075 [Wolbachia endosymbiont of Spodoptera picta]|uniref:hypothetical protein n=1 Tax=Wolbachia endosymbiont of Spodoptera picta TaxID=2769078 RepID=UPI001BAC1DC4|nr:hypothetical protein [Wolbachia endosymbiont of Spodoptera picta]QUI60265.1 hypothetical protein JKF54_05075 [Wolbachia endosymbiont of Spodoptera picta]